MVVESLSQMSRAPLVPALGANAKLTATTADALPQVGLVLSTV